MVYSIIYGVTTGSTPYICTLLSINIIHYAFWMERRILIICVKIMRDFMLNYTIMWSIKAIFIGLCC